MWHKLPRSMASEVLRARVDRELARKVQRWAKDHRTGVSETIRIALRRLVEEDTRSKAFADIERKFDEWERMGLFDPPKGPWKAGGFR